MGGRELKDWRVGRWKLYMGDGRELGNWRIWEEEAEVQVRQYQYLLQTTTTICR